jgi:hypothetical protein
MSFYYGVVSQSYIYHHKGLLKGKHLRQVPIVIGIFKTPFTGILDPSITIKRVFIEVILEIFILI